MTDRLRAMFCDHLSILRGKYLPGSKMRDDESRFARPTFSVHYDKDLIIDAPPAHKEVEFKVDIFHPKEGAYRPLSQVSPVVAALAKTQFDDYVKRVRVFAEPTLARELSGRSEFTAWLTEAARG